ncbi:MAG: CBS domain-containing protein [Bacteroidales bacterium]
MYAYEIMTDHISPVKTSDAGVDALSLMEDFKVSQLPIVNNEEYLGMISERDIYTLNRPDEPLGNHKLSLSRLCVKKNDHIFEAIRLIGMHKLSLIPVVDEQDKYMGCITLEQLAVSLSKLDLISSPGGIIVLEMSINNYSLQEITQIVESNNARILGLYIKTSDDSTRMTVTLKLNKVDIVAVLQTFNRYDYIVKASYSYKEDVFDDLEDRYRSLMNYLDIGRDT